MKGILVANANANAARQIAAVLRSAGLPVFGVAVSGAKVLDFCRSRGEVCVCGGFLPDMPLRRLTEMAGGRCDFILTLKATEWPLLQDVTALGVRIPIVRTDLIATVNLMFSLDQPPSLLVKKRMEAGQEDEKKVLLRAKELLMQRNGLSESQAHRFLQKKSMNAGNKLIESAWITLLRT